MGYKCLCHKCRKVFYAMDLGEWAYKKNGYYFCSWGCLRRYEQQIEIERKEALKNGKKKTVHK